MKWMMVAGLLLGSGVALADDDYRYNNNYNHENWQERRADRMEQRREEARQELQQRLDECHGRNWCRRRAYREYHRDLARIDRHQF